MEIFNDILNVYGEHATKDAVIANLKFTIDGTEYDLLYDKRLNDKLLVSVTSTVQAKRYDSVFPMYIHHFTPAIDHFETKDAAIDIANKVLNWEKMSPMILAGDNGKEFRIFLEKFEYIGDLDEFVLWDEHEDFELVWEALTDFMRNIKVIENKQ